MFGHLPPIPYMLATAIVLFLGIGLHEYAHCKFADMAGDPTPRYYGRVTLDLTKHFEPLGTLMMVITTLSGFGIGWGRAAPIDSTKMRNPRVDTFVAVAAGPISNIVQAVIYGTVLRFLFQAQSPLLGQEFVRDLLLLGVQVNLALALFNLIPFGPLDGHWLIGELLPERQRFYWYRFNRTIGRNGLLIIILLLQASGQNGVFNFLEAPLNWGFRVITGIPLF